MRPRPLGRFVLAALAAATFLAGCPEPKDKPFLRANFRIVNATAVGEDLTVSLAGESHAAGLGVGEISCNQEIVGSVPFAVATDGGTPLTLAPSLDPEDPSDRIQSSATDVTYVLAGNADDGLRRYPLIRLVAAGAGNANLNVTLAGVAYGSNPGFDVHIAPLGTSLSEATRVNGNIRLTADTPRYAYADAIRGFAPGSYVASLTRPGTTEVVASETVTLAADDAYTLIFREPTTGSALETILIDMNADPAAGCVGPPAPPTVGTPMNASGTNVRFLNVIPGVTGLEGRVDGSTLGTVGEGPAVSGFLPVTADLHDLAVRLPGTSTDLDNASRQFGNEFDVTVIATGFTLSGFDSRDLILVGDLPPSANRIRVALAHAEGGSLRESGIDLYAVASSDTNLSDNTPILAGLTYTETLSADLAPGTYRLVLTAHRQKTPLASVLVNGVGGNAYLAVAHAAEGSTALYVP